MNFDEIMGKVLQIFPDAIFAEDELGEVTISTGFTLSNNKLVPMEGN